MSLGIKSKAKDIVLKGDTLEAAVLSTMKTLSDIVGATLGPGGNPVLLERPGMPPLITKDGVTVAGHVSFKDALQHVISEAAKEASMRTNREAGDGTTTAIVLAEAIVRYGTRFLKDHSMKSPQEVTRELNRLGDDLVQRLKDRARKVENNEDLTKVAMVSSNFDVSVANAVVEAIDMVGNDGTIITEEGSRKDTYVEIQEGFPVRRGLRSFGAAQEIWINSPATQECVMAKPLVLLYDGELLEATPVGNFLIHAFNAMGEAKDIRPVIIVAHKFSPQVLRMFAQNSQNGFMMVPLETPSSIQPNGKHHFLHDLAAFTGSRVLDPLNNSVESVTPGKGDEDMDPLAPLGSVNRARFGRDQSYFFDPLDENKEALETRIEALKGQQEGAEHDLDRDVIKERTANLFGGIATIFVGGSSDLEIKEKKHRIEDAICATRSAIEEGILPGGGAMLAVLAWELVLEAKLPLSAKILSDALTEPFNRIASNAGESEKRRGEAKKDVVESAVNGVPTLVYDSLRHQLVEPYSTGIVDPVKVTISALRNALSIAQMLMTVGGAIVLPRDLAEERQVEAAALQAAASMQGT